MKMAASIALGCAVLVSGIGLLATRVLGAKTELSGSLAQYETAKVSPGQVTVTVTATGRIEPWKVVDVGTEVSGRVEEVLVQANDKVTAGQVIARIRSADQDIRVRNAHAYAARSAFAIQEAESNRRIQADMLARKIMLAEDQLIAASELVQAREALRQADSRIAQLHADRQVQALQLESSTRDLEKTTIVSPIDGVVLTQRVEAGQTLASTMTTPVMFRIASDLSTLKLLLSVDEADIGRVKAGLSTEFTVEAYPNKVFKGTVDSVQLEPNANSRSVTYITVVKAENPAGLLLPGMSANAEIHVAYKKAAVTIPVEAISFQPVGFTTPTASLADIGGLLALMEPAAVNLPPELLEEYRSQAGSARNLVKAINEARGGGGLNKSKMEVNAFKAIFGPFMAKLPLDDPSGLRQAYQAALKSETAFVYVAGNKVITGIPVRYGEVGDKTVEVLDARLKVGDIVLVGEKPKDAEKK